MRRRGLTEGDRQVWAQYAQLVTRRAGVDPVVAPAPAPLPASEPGLAAPAAALPKPLVARRLPALEVGTTPGGIDRATWARFRAGKLPPVRTLDLHGLTAQRAHAALHGFVSGAVAERLRCVEVITGRGSGESGGVIRREFPLWLNGPGLRPMVLAAAHPHAANTGSVRLLLRRVR